MLVQFAAVMDQAAATTKKLEKQRILADYFRPLNEADLKLAVRYAGGRIFPTTTEHVLGVSGAILRDASLSLLAIEPAELRTLAIRSGELGEALAVVWNSHRTIAASGEPLTLAEMAAAFELLSSTGNQSRKREIVSRLLARCAQPREAAYLAKVIFSDLRTGVREGVLQAGVAAAFEKPLAEIQRTQFLIGDLDEVAILAKHDALSSAAFTLFHPVQFMLATPQETAAEAAATAGGRAYFAEDKLDGIRAQVHKSGEGVQARIAIYTRTMDRTDDSFPEVVEQLRQIPGSFLLDGEIAPYRDGRVLPFAHIQTRLGRKNPPAKILRDNPAVFIAFDLLYRNEELLMERPLRERRERLHQFRCDCAMLISEVKEVASAEEIESAFAAARDAGNEGLMLKDPQSPYSPGRRGQAWLKLKTHLPTLDCVVTAAEYGHGKRRNSLSDYTFAVWDKEPATNEDARLVNIGKAYSGVTDEEIATLTKTFMELAISNNGRVFQVAPKIVLEIACDQIQPSARHASGFALRFPRIKRIRWDKGPLDAERLSRIEEIYNSASNTAKRLPATVDASEVAEPTLFDRLTD